jgi:hypothetical protein
MYLSNKSILMYIVGVCLGFLGGFLGFLGGFAGSLMWVCSVLWGFSSFFFL